MLLYYFWSVKYAAKVNCMLKLNNLDWPSAFFVMLIDLYTGSIGLMKVQCHNYTDD